MTDALTELSMPINLKRMQPKLTTEYQLNDSTPWLQELLLELNENCQDENPEDLLGKSEFQLDLNLTKAHNAQLGEHLLATGSFSILYFTQDVKTLKTIPQTLQMGFHSCFLEQRFETSEEYAEQTDIFVRNETYDLYFYSKGLVDLKEMLHEQIYLHLNPYPSLSEDQSH